MLPHRLITIQFGSRRARGIGRSNLLNRIFITRGRRTVYSSSAWLTKETVHPLPSHYNKNKHSSRGFIDASGAMLILYQSKSTPRIHTHFLNKNRKSEDGKSHLISSKQRKIDRGVVAKRKSLQPLFLCCSIEIFYRIGVHASSSTSSTLSMEVMRPRRM